MSRLFSIWMSIAMTASFCACSVVSGWSDLQGGRPPGQADARGRDEGSDLPEVEASTPDAPDQPDSGLNGVFCGAARCGPGQGCCVGFNSSQRCSTEQACSSADGENFLTCTRASSCPMTAPVCCYDFTAGMRAACFAACGSGQQELCAASDSRPCTAPKSCTGNLSGANNVPACN